MSEYTSSIEEKKKQEEEKDGNPHQEAADARKKIEEEDILKKILGNLRKQFGTRVDLTKGGITEEIDILTQEGFKEAHRKMSGGNCRDVAEKVAEAMKEIGMSVVEYTLSAEETLRYVDPEKNIDQLVSDTDPARHVFVVWEDKEGRLRVIDPTIIQNPIDPEEKKVRLENISSPLEEYLGRFSTKDGKINNIKTLIRDIEGKFPREKSDSNI